MEFLFTGQVASIEIYILFLCIGSIAYFFLYEKYLYGRGVFLLFFPKKPPSEEEIIHTGSDSISTDSSNMLLPSNPPENTLMKLDDVHSFPEEILTPPIPEIPLIHPVLVDIPVVSPDITLTWATQIDSEEVSLGENLEGELSSERDISPKESTPSHRRSKKEKLIDTVNTVKTLLARGHVDDARTALVSGLALDKNHRELNIIMATIYEREHAFAKAEYILKDIATTYPDDIEILTHLATDLAMQRKYEVSYELYKKILSLGDETEGTLYTLIHLASEMSLPLDVTRYARMYLKQFPHNPDILWLYSQSQISNGERRDATDTLIKLKNLTPYNQEIADLIQKLVTEEELAGNFGHTTH